ncbi:MAG TPA: AI-2E family transporter [Streptosporangiaceae bacterium]|nr:AI-2E family transporter [Streptosporangiaceae bacterium]
MAGRSARGIGQQIRERAGSLLATARARRAAARDPTADAPPAAGAGHIDGTGGYPPGEPAPASPAGPPDASAALVPRWLQAVAGWSWRLLVVAAVVYLLYRVAGRLTVVVVPCLAALLLTALLQPLTARLHRAGLPMLAATWCTLVGAVIVLAGTITLVTVRVRAEYPSLVSQVRHTIRQLQTWLAGPPLHLKTANLQKLGNEITTYLSQHKTVVAGTVVTGGEIVVEILAGVVLMLFVTFFLLKDGERIWSWLLRAAGRSPAGRADHAGRAAWLAVVYYMRGTVLVAATHAVVIAVTLSIVGVPLVAAMAVLVFLSSFIPLVGLLFAGALVILLTLVTKGWLAAVIVLAIFVGEDQVESHLLQPLVVGRIVRLHPLAIILCLAVGSEVAGIPGAVVAVPVAAAINRAAPELRRRPARVAATPGTSTAGPASPPDLPDPPDPADPAGPEPAASDSGLGAEPR